jgi:WD40 repeat protein
VLLGPPAYKSPLSGFALSPDERQVVLLKPSNKVFEVDLATLKPAFGGQERDAVPGVYWTSNTTVNYHFKTSSYIWTPTSNGESKDGSLVANNLPSGNVRAVALSPQHDVCAGLMSGETVVIFRLQGNGFRTLLATVNFDATAAALPKDAEFVVLGGKEGSLRAYSMTVKANGSAKEVATFKGHSGTIRAIACTLDGTTMASGGDDKTVRVWDIASGTQLQRFPHPGTVTSLVVTPDGRYVISACADSMIRVWSLAK